MSESVALAQDVMPIQIWISYGCHKEICNVSGVDKSDLYLIHDWIQNHSSCLRLAAEASVRKQQFCCPSRELRLAYEMQVYFNVSTHWDRWILLVGTDRIANGSVCQVWDQTHLDSNYHTYIDVNANWTYDWCLSARK